MTAFSSTETHLALRNILLGVAGIPAQRAWENAGTFTPTPGTPYLDESFVPATQSLLSIVAGGVTERTGLYVVSWYGIAGAGITAIRQGTDAILAAFTPGASRVMTSGLVLRIRGDVGPWGGQLIPMDTGFACVVVTVPWRVYASNPAS